MVLLQSRCICLLFMHDLTDPLRAWCSPMNTGPTHSPPGSPDAPAFGRSDLRTRDTSRLAEPWALRIPAILKSRQHKHPECRVFLTRGPPTSGHSGLLALQTPGPPSSCPTRIQALQAPGAGRPVRNIPWAFRDPGIQGHPTFQMLQFLNVPRPGRFELRTLPASALSGTPNSGHSEIQAIPAPASLSP